MTPDNRTLPLAEPISPQRPSAIFNFTRIAWSVFWFTISLYINLLSGCDLIFWLFLQTLIMSYLMSCCISRRRPIAKVEPSPMLSVKLYGGTFSLHKNQSIAHGGRAIKAGNIRMTSATVTRRTHSTAFFRFGYYLHWCPEIISLHIIWQKLRKSVW